MTQIPGQGRSRRREAGRPYQPAVTVYIVNHNYSRFLAQAIESVLGQTSADFELIIIDNGSTDESREVIRRYESNDRVVTIFQHNAGLTVANNIALRAAKGRYIMRLDGDDYLDVHALEIMTRALDRDPGLGLVFPDYYLIDVEGHVLEIVRRHDFVEVTMLDQPAHGACTMIRVDCLKELGGYNEALRCQDGYDLWLRFIQCYKVSNVRLPLFYYRKHRQSLTTNEKALLEARAEILTRQARQQALTLKVMAVIPVRGQATDPGSMALRHLGGKPLINWTIDAALAAAQVSDVLVTSPDDELLHYVRGRYGDAVICLKRARQAALLNTPLEGSVLDALSAYLALGHSEPDAVAVLFVESPFRLARHIDNAVDAMKLFDTDSVVGVRPETDTFYRHDGHGLRPVRSGTTLRLEAEELYREVGDTRLVRTAHLRDGRAVTEGRIGHIVIDEKCAHAVLTEWQWRVAELLVAESLLSSQPGTVVDAGDSTIPSGPAARVPKS